MYFSVENYTYIKEQIVFKCPAFNEKSVIKLTKKTEGWAKKQANHSKERYRHSLKSRFRANTEETLLHP